VRKWNTMGGECTICIDITSILKTLHEGRYV
jgi:hypothetical protein